MVADYLAVFRSTLYAKKPLYRFVLLHIALQQKPDKGCYMSANEIAAGLSISRSTVQRALKTAQTDGILRTESFRNHKGHKVTQKWIVVQASPDDAKPMCQADTNPSVSENYPKRQTKQTQASPDDALLVKTLIDTSMIEKNKIEETAHSAQIKTVSVAGRSFTRSEWETTAKNYQSFGSGIAQVRFVDGSADYAVIGWDDMRHRHVLRSRFGGQLFA